MNTDYRDIMNAVNFREMICTGPVDAFFGLRYGKLPCRSIEFKLEKHDEEVFQPSAVIS